MELIDELEEEIDKLKDNEYGLKVIKNKYRGIITTSIIIPQDIINKEISEMTIEFQLIIDTNSLKLMPKLYCVSPFCFPQPRRRLTIAWMIVLAVPSVYMNIRQKHIGFL